MKSLVVIVALCACQHRDPPAASSVASVDVPVGPIPGPGVESAANSNPYGNDAEAVAQGRILFRRFNCAGCHGEHAGGGMGVSLRDTEWLYGDSDAHIYDSIAEGRGHGMPAWGVKLPEPQIWQLVAYIRSLRTPEEPDQP
jgi:cytochrome c oxidase cbb3-type subunit 3